MKYTIKYTLINLYKIIIKLLCVFVPIKFLRKKIKKATYLKYSDVLRNDFWKLLFFYLFIHPKHFKYYLSLTICVKDESEYIIEWLEYYLIQGVDHFYIYNNNGTDNTKEIIKDYIDKGIVTWTDYPGYKVQEKIYNDSISKHKYETRWMGFIDIDEFIVPLKDKDLKTFMKDFEDYNQIYINWVMYGSSGHKTKTKGLVIERFTKHWNSYVRLAKSILNPRATINMAIHLAYVFGNTVNEKKIIMKNFDPTFKNKNIAMSIDRIRINHYIIKSYEEVLEKKIRRTKNVGTDIIEDIDDYFKSWDINDIDEPELMKPYIEKIYKRLNKTKIQ